MVIDYNIHSSSGCLGKARVIAQTAVIGAYGCMQHLPVLLQTLIAKVLHQTRKQNLRCCGKDTERIVQRPRIL